MNTFYPWQLELACWENEPGDEGQGGDEGEQGGQGGEQKPTGQGGKVFTQEEVDKFVTKRNKTLKAQYESLEKNYETLLQNSQMSQEQRDQLEADLENVRAQMRTKEQQLQYEKKKELEKFSQQLKTTQEQANYYKSLYENSTIERSIIDAASANEGYDGSQFVALLRDKAKVVEELDESGQKTGRLVPKIQWTVTDPDTKKSEVVLKDPSEVVLSMKEDVQRYGNLFKSNVARGLGQGQAAIPGARGRVDAKNISQDQYRELRKTAEGRRALGLE